MLYVIRQCKSCGGDVDITEGKYLAFSTPGETCYICQDCLFRNPTFRHIATTYALERAEEIMNTHKEEAQCKSF